MQNRKLIILIVLWIIAAISLIYGIVTPSKIRREISKGETVVGKYEKAQLTKKNIPETRYAKRTDFTTWGRNPFLSKEVVIKRYPGVILNGIVWDERNPTAIINGIIVSIGDRVDGNRVIDIMPEKVVLNDGISNFEIKLRE